DDPARGRSPRGIASPPAGLENAACLATLGCVTESPYCVRASFPPYPSRYAELRPMRPPLKPSPSRGRAPAPGRKRLRLIDEGDKEVALFFLRWLQAPGRIGAVAPSSRHLGRAMARQVAVNGSDPVIELGGGTGSVTRALLEAGIAPERLVVVEKDERLYRLLRARFPELRIVKGDARRRRRLLAPLGIGKAAAVVSSLPLISLPR